MKLSYKHIDYIQFARPIHSDLVLIINMVPQDKFVGTTYADSFHNDADGLKLYEQDLTQAEVNHFLKKLEDLQLLEMPYSIDFIDFEKIPAISFTIGEDRYSICKNPKDPDWISKVYQLFEDLLGVKPYDFENNDDLYVAEDYNQLTVLSFLAPSSRGYHDVFIDIEEKWASIETIDVEGILLEETTHKKLRRSSLNKFIETVKETDLYKWPVNPSPLEADGEFSKISYNIDEYEFNSPGPDDLNQLRKLHKAMETLIGETFGTYKWYDKN